MNYSHFILIALGLFLIAAGALDWRWFMEFGNQRRMEALMGRNGARIFTVVIGVILAGLGVAGMMGMLPG